MKQPTNSHPRTRKLLYRHCKTLIALSLAVSTAAPQRFARANSYAGGNDISLAASPAAGAASPAANGGATWSVPFALPPGRDGMTPNLGLSYASDGGNSWVGRGWSFGVASIERDTSAGVPNYDDTDRFVLSGVGVLVPFGTHPSLGAKEYRATRDDGETQVLLLEDNTWVVRTRDGRVSFFAPIIQRSERSAGPPTAPDPTKSSDTFRWALVKTRDRAGNTIEYDYGVANDWSEFGVGGVGTVSYVPRLTAVWYGGNDGSPSAYSSLTRTPPESTPGRQPHLFRVSIHRDGRTREEAHRLDSTPPRPCLDRGYQAVSWNRAGFQLSDINGVGELVRSVVVEAAWPGTTAPTGDRAHRFRQVRAWQLAYDSDFGGCESVHHLFPALRRVRAFAWNENGERVEQPKVEFDYNSWERTWQHHSISLPAVRPISHTPGFTFGWGGVPGDAGTTGGSTTYTLSDLPAVEGPSLGMDLTGDPFFHLAAGISTQSTDIPVTMEGLGHIFPPERRGNRWSASRMLLPGMRQGLVDLDGDALPDMLDLAANQHCVGGGIPSTDSQSARWFRLRNLTYGFDSAQPWSFDNSLLNREEQSELFFERPVQYCGLNQVVNVLPGRWGASASAYLGTLPITANRTLYIDYDGDGDNDILFTKFNQFQAILPPAPDVGKDQEFGNVDWYVARNVSNNGVIQFDPPVAIPPGPWVGLAGGPTYYPDRHFWFYPTDAPTSRPGALPENFDGSRVLNASMTFDNADMRAGWFAGFIWSSQAAGYLADYTGDGIPDRIVAVSSGAGVVDSQGSLVVFPGLRSGGWGNGRVWHRNYTNKDSILITPSASISPDRNASDTGSVRFFSLRPDGTGGPVYSNVSGRGYVTFGIDQSIDINSDGLLDIVTSQFRLRENADGMRGLKYWTDAPSTMLNLGHRFAEPSTIVAGPGSIEAWTITRTSTRGPLTIGSELLAAGTETTEQFPIDFNGDGYVDLVNGNRGWVSYNVGLGPKGYHPIGTLPPGIKFVSESVATRGGEETSHRQLIVDVTGDGRPDIVRVNRSGTPSIDVWTDADQTAAPGALHRVRVEGGAETEFSYQTLHDALDGQPQQTPVSSWVLQSARSRPTATAAWSTTSYRYDGVVFGPSPEREVVLGVPRPFSHRSTLRGFQRVRVCNPSGSMTEARYSFDETASGVPYESTVYQSCDVGSQPLHRTNTEYQVRHIAAPHYSGDPYYETVRVLPETVRTTHWEQSATGWASETTKIKTQYASRNDAVVVETITEEVVGVPRITTLTTAVANADTSQSYFQRVTSRRVEGDNGYGVNSLLAWTDTEFDYGAPNGPGFVTAVSQHRSATSPTLTARTAMSVDSYGHPLTVTSPEGRVSRICWDRYRMYPVKAQANDNRIVESTYSYVTGRVIQSAGPTGVEPIWQCDSGSSGSPHWGNPVDDPSPRLPAIVVAESDLIAPTTPVADPMHEHAVGSRAPAASAGVPHQPSWTFAFERRRPSTITDESPYQGAVSYPYLSNPTWTRTTPPSPAPAAAPTAPGTRVFTDGLGRLIQGDVAERTSGGALTFLPVVQRSYSTGSMWWVLNTAYFNSPGGAALTGYSMSYLDGWGRSTADYVYDPSGTWDGAYHYYDATGTSSSVVASSQDERYLSDYASSWQLTDVLGRAASSSVAQIGGTYIPGAANLIERFHRTGPASAAVPSNASFYTEVSGAGPRSRSYLDLWGRVVASDTEVEAGVWLRSKARYDGLGRVVEVVEEDGAVVRTTFDLLGRVESSKRFGSEAMAMSGVTPSRTEINSYNLDGQLLQSASLSGTTNYQYDSLGRLEWVKPPVPSGGALAGHGDIHYVYQDNWTLDGFGQIKQVLSPTEQVSTTFDARGRVTSEQHTVALSVTAPSDGATVALADSYTFNFEYNRAGMPTKIEHRDSGAVLKRTVEIEYDSRGRTLRMTDVSPTGVRRVLAHNHWRSNGALQSRTDDFSGEFTPLHEWDGAARELRVATSGITQWVTSITRDAATRWPTAITNNPVDRPANTATITHDLSGRLQHVSNPGLSYDLQITRDASNLARTGRIVQSAPGALARDVTPQYRSTSGTAGADPGAITELRRLDGSALVANVFDTDGTVIQRTGSGATGVMRADEQGRVRERGNNRYFYGADGSRTHVFVATGERIIAQVGLLDIEYKRVGANFVRDRVEFIVPGGNVPLARVDENNNKVAFLHTDAQGSVSYVRGSTASDSVRIEYTPFGEVLSSRESGTYKFAFERRRFQGGITDPSGTGYLQFGARLYDPMTQQWASADPAFHTYAYGFVGGSPYLMADPSGLAEGFVATASPNTTITPTGPHPRLGVPTATHDVREGATVRPTRKPPLPTVQRPDPPRFRVTGDGHHLQPTAPSQSGTPINRGPNEADTSSNNDDDLTDEIATGILGAAAVGGAAVLGGSAGVSAGEATALSLGSGAASAGEYVWQGIDMVDSSPINIDPGAQRLAADLQAAGLNLEGTNVRVTDVPRINRRGRLVAVTRTELDIVLRNVIICVRTSPGRKELEESLRLYARYSRGRTVIGYALADNETITERIINEMTNPSAQSRLTPLPITNNFQELLFILRLLENMP